MYKLRAESAGRVALRATQGGACNANASQDITDSNRHPQWGFQLLV